MRGAVDKNYCSLLDLLIQEKMKDPDDYRLIMGNTKVFDCSNEKEQKVYNSIHKIIEPVFKVLLSLLFINDDPLLADICLRENIVLMLKDANCRFAQLPHADSMDDNIRMLLFTRY